MDDPDGLRLVEVKAGKTVTPDLMAPVRRIAETLGARAASAPCIVYGGDDQDRAGCTLVSWRRAARVAATR